MTTDLLGDLISPRWMHQVDSKRIERTFAHRQRGIAKIVHKIP